MRWFQTTTRIPIAKRSKTVKVQSFKNATEKKYKISQVWKLEWKKKFRCSKVKKMEEIKINIEYFKGTKSKKGWSNFKNFERKNCTKIEQFRLQVDIFSIPPAFPHQIISPASLQTTRKTYRKNTSQIPKLYKKKNNYTVKNARGSWKISSTTPKNFFVTGYKLQNTQKIVNNPFKRTTTNERNTSALKCTHASDEPFICEKVFSKASQNHAANPQPHREFYTPIEYVLWFSSQETWNVVRKTESRT